MEWRDEGGRDSNESQVRSAWENKTEWTVPKAKGTIDPVVPPWFACPREGIAGNALILFLDRAGC
jgi:hypothetical protein